MGCNSFGNSVLFVFFNDTATTEIYTLSLHDALPIYAVSGDVKRPAPICVLAVYTGIRCQPFFARGHTGCSFTRRIEMSLPTCMSSGKTERQSSGWNQSAWRAAAASAGRKLHVSKDWSRKTRPFC